MAENKLIAGILIGIILVFVIGVFVIVPVIGDISADIPNSTDENSTTNSTGEDFVFDNSTPEATAISIALLNEGMCSSEDMVVNVSLTSNRKYWIVGMDDTSDNWVVTVDAKTLMSKKSGGMEGPTNTWRSLDELKANYIAEIQSGVDTKLDRPYKTTLNGKTIWKVPMYLYVDTDAELYGYVYVDVTTGKSKFVDLSGYTEGWMTLKEVDNSINEEYNNPNPPFRDALRDLYLE